MMMHVPKLKIYSNKAWLHGQKPLGFLQPFWGYEPECPHQPNTLKNYIQLGPNIIDMTNEEEAEVAVFPIALRTRDYEIEVEKVTAELNHLKLITFSVGDEILPIPFDNTINFKFSYLNSLEHIPTRPVLGCPTHSGDLLYTYADGIDPLEKTIKPRVGFCGHIKFPQIRIDALVNIRQCDDIITDYIGHHLFFAGKHRNDTAGLMGARKIFVENVINNHYTICAKGGGNFSYRLCETLNCGRVPIFVNTDCIMPVSTIIDWNKYCVWVEKDQIEDISQIVLNHYNSYSPEEFINLQKECRIFWEQYLSPEGFFSHLGEIVRPYL